MKVKDCMCNQVACLNPDSTVEECAKLMCDKHIGCVPVCDNSNKVVGLITDRDILLRTVGCGKELKNTPVSDIMTCNVCCCGPDTDIAEAEKLMSENQIRRLPVMANNRIVGILTIGDLAANENINIQGVCNTLENICGCGNKNAE